MNLRHDLDLDFALRSVGSLPTPNVPAYVVLDVHLGWKISRAMNMSLSGFNLLDNRHPEFGSSASRSEIGRSVYVKLLWGF
ncbi:MAG: TonB-dependent receptor [Gallionella sp.]